MPTYEFLCECGSKFDRYLRVADYRSPQTCECGRTASRLISIPMVFVSPDICYDSPIDGRPITSMKARLEDLARADCVPYDPGRKQDYTRRIERESANLEKSIDETVEAEIHSMPSRKREKLEAELQGGMTVEPIRTTPTAKDAHA